MTQQTVDTARVHVWVTGRVQAVGFRAFVVEQAQSLGLTGWVRNVGYSQVEMVAEGRRELLENFVDIVRRGPTASRVDEAQVEWESSTGGFLYFEVHRSL